MKERPILFSGPMVRAILEGRKTQTRRIIGGRFHSQPVYIEPNEATGSTGLWSYVEWDGRGEPGHYIEESFEPIRERLLFTCPYGVPGDRLWVRETWNTWGTLDHIAPNALPKDTGIAYAADMEHPAQEACGKFRPSIFMPRWASRITLEVTGVRVERLQDISEADAVAEGVDVGQRATLPGDERRLCVACGGPKNTHIGVVKACPQRSSVYSSLTWKGGFHFLWESINGPGSWDANPWVWVIEFKRLEAP